VGYWDRFWYNGCTYSIGEVLALNWVALDLCKSWGRLELFREDDIWSLLQMLFFVYKFAMI
jgi:hypothetical protein